MNRGKKGSAVAALVALSTYVGVIRAEEALLGGAFKVCSRSDPNLNECIVDTINGARTKLSEGVPELGLPSLRPLRGDVLRIEEGDGDFQLRVTMRDFMWWGVDDFVVTQARVNLSRTYMEIDTIFRPMNSSGTYNFGGALLTLRISGQGEHVIHFV